VVRDLAGEPLELGGGFGFCDLAAHRAGLKRPAAPFKRGDCFGGAADLSSRRQPLAKENVPMRRLLPLALAAASASMFAMPAAAQPAPSPNALLAQENEVWQAVADQRLDAFAAFLARDYAGVYPDGIKDIAQEVAAVRGITLARFQISDFVVRGIDANNLVVTYRIDGSGTQQGQAFAGRYNIASYWHRTGRQWRVQLHSETPILP
jgi:hypothetical protein